MNYVIYDIETTLTCFIIVLKDFKSKKILKYKISNHQNDFLKIVDTFDKLKKLNYYFVGFNNLNFDAQVMDFILKGNNDVFDIYKESQRIINLPDESKYLNMIPEWKLSFNNLDVYKILHYDNAARRSSLKWLEFSLRLPDIEEMPLAHNISYTLEQEDLTMEYCINDVNATEEIFSKILEEVDLRFDTKKAMGLNCLNHNNGKLGMDILLTKYSKKIGKDKNFIKKLEKEKLYNIDIKNLIYPYIKFNTIHFNSVLDRFNKEIWTYSSEKKTKSEKGLFTLDYKSSKGDYGFIYGWGGLHQCIKPGVYTADDDHIILDADVGSLYPSIPITYYLHLLEQSKEYRDDKLLQVNNPVIFPPHLGLDVLLTYKEDIVDVRLAEKAKPKKEQNSVIIKGLKEAANIPYGKSGEETSWFYSKRYNLTTTVNGQLLISMLVEALYDIPDCILLQTNTDGVTVRIHKKYKDLYFEKCKEFEKQTKLTLEYAEYSKMVIVNVNNYLAEYTDGKVKRKGATFEIYEDFVNNKTYHKNPSLLIINLAVNNYFTKGIPVETTIKNHDNIYDFCGGVKVKSDFKLNYYILDDLKENLTKTSQQKVTRYYISKTIGSLKKDYHDGRQTNIHVGINTKPLNKITTVDPKKYDIDYNYYIKEAQKIITSIEPIGQLQLF
jgi:hypothetical protein